MSGGPLLLVVIVRQLHNARDYPELQTALCAECRQTWPCATEKAIRQWEAIPDVGAQTASQVQPMQDPYAATEAHR